MISIKWTSRIMCSLKKKEEKKKRGNTDDPSNYRGFFLLSVVRKVCACFIQIRYKFNTTFNTAVTETDSEILGKHRQKKNPGLLQ